MPITIITPKPAALPRPISEASDSDSSTGGADVEGDISMRPAKRSRPRRSHSNNHEIVTPGEIITDDPQWMRGHGTYLAETSITASVAGTITRTNKLLSVRPLRARYTPEVGDLVVGRVVDVRSRQWRVDVGAAQLASLPLSAINLPGGVLRRRTDTDELAIRSFFAEGDLLVAEVQQLRSDGGATLHARSLRYGKLRNGLFTAVSGVGGGGGVVRARRQAWRLEAANGGGLVDVILGVNGYVWISKHVEDASPAAGEGGLGASGDKGGAVGITSIEENVSAMMYSSQNDRIEVATMREMARVRGVITALVENGLRVDEDMVMKGYHEAVEMALQSPEDIYLGGERGKQLAATLVGR